MNYFIVIMQEDGTNWCILQTQDEEYAYKVFEDLCIPVGWNSELRATEEDVGWYIELEEGNGCKKWECSECKGIFRSSQKPWYKFCPHCGIKFINKEECK